MSDVFAGPGHNSQDPLLKGFVERIERLEEEKKALSDDIRDVFAEAKGNGFDVKALRQVIKHLRVERMISPVNDWPCTAPSRIIVRARSPFSSDR